MVVPLLAAGGRVVVGSARVVQKSTSTASKQQSKSAIVLNRSLRQAAEAESLAEQQVKLRAMQQSVQNKLHQKKNAPAKALDHAKGAVRKAKVAVVHIDTALPLAGLYVVQLVGYFFYNFGEYILSYWIVDKINTYVITLDWMWQIGWAIGTLAGLLSLLILAFAYSAALVNWVKGWSPLVLMLCAALYFAPTLLIIPWVGLWMTVVFWTKTS